MATKKKEDIGDAQPETSTGTSSATTGKSATPPDEVNMSAKLGGQTVEKLKEDRSGPAGDDDEEATASGAPRLARSGKAKGEMRLNPATGDLLVGNSYTASIPVDVTDADNVTFMHPAGWDVKASISAGMANGTFLVERPRDMRFGFKINGKKVAEATYKVKSG